jgi:hypothetical protein
MGTTSDEDREERAMGDTTQTPCERVSAYFGGDEFDLAVRALASYYAPDYHYTGSAFDHLIATSPPGCFTSIDMLAVSMLSVTVPPRAALWLVDSSEASDLLAELPIDASVWDNPELLDRDGAAWKLWKVTDDRYGVGATIASKLLAAKRPKLIPIYDRHVDEALNFGTSEWAFWQMTARGDSVGELLSNVEAAKTRAGVPRSVTALRTIDVVVWMRQHGWTTHDAQKCRVGCNFTGFGAQ